MSYFENIFDEAGKVPKEVIAELKKEASDWEKERVSSGMGVFTAKERIAHLEKVSGITKLDVINLNKEVRRMSAGFFLLSFALLVHLVVEIFS